MKKLISLLMTLALLPSTYAPALSTNTTSEPIEPGMLNCDYFRIPAMITLQSGRVLVSTDIRYGNGSDSPANIDTGVCFSDDNGEHWTPLQPINYFTDMEDVTSDTVPTNTASFIDSALIEDADGTVYLICDACPAYIGSAAARKNENGYIDGKLVVCDKTTESGVESGVLDKAHYPYYIGDFQDGFAPVCRFDDDTVYENYYVDRDFNLYIKDGALTSVSIPQLDSLGKVTKKTTQANIFYAGSPIKVYPTFYLWLRTSNDGGETWNDATILNPQVHAKGFTGVCPGRGFYANGRVFFAVYEHSNGTEVASVIYSDDNGITWHRSEKADGFGRAKKSSESQMVMLPDGTLRLYSRNSANYISYADSHDNGETWSDYKLDKSLRYCSDCMVSFLNYSEKIDGKNVILASYPTTSYRRLGVIRIGLVDEKGKIDWAYQRNITSDLENTTFNYSCLAELSDGRIAMLYENEWRKITYKTFSLEELMVHEKQPSALQFFFLRILEFFRNLFSK